MNVNYLKGLLAQYKVLQESGMVMEVKLITMVGEYSITNDSAIAKMLQAAIAEAEREINDEDEQCKTNESEACCRGAIQR